MSEDGKKAWGAPFNKLDRAWSKLDARLCAFVLVADILTLFPWISIKALSSTGKAGPGYIFRVAVAAAVVGGIAHLVTRKRVRDHELLTTAFVVLGVLLGSLWGDVGVEYFANWLGWLQNASILVFFGGASEMAKRFTLWLALLGASVATAQGKHINVDVVMRFLKPRARVPVAVVGWLAAALVCLLGVWGFFDHIAVEEYRANTSLTAGGKIGVVVHDTGRDLFLARKQLSLDLKTLPKVLGGAPYSQTLSGKEWNDWLHDGGWDSYFKAEDIKAMEASPDSTEMRTPAVTSMPGGSEPILKLLVREVNFVFAFGLLVIGLRFILRSILAIAGWIKVDPNAAHGDEDLAHAHDDSPLARQVDAASEGTTTHGAPYRDGIKAPPLVSDTPDPKAARLTFGILGAVVFSLGLVGGVVAAIVATLALLGTPLFAILGGVSEIAWLTHADPEQQLLRRLAPDIFGSRFAGSPILTTIPLFTFVGYLMAESKTPERLVRAATSWVGWLPGGLAIVCVLASAVFTLFTGGSGVTIIAVGGLLLPALKGRGYSDKFSVGLVTTGGSLGLLLPYALPLLVYAMVTGLDFQLVNKAVILPGVFVLGLFVLYAAYIGVKEKIPRTPFDSAEALSATWAFKWEMGVFVLLVIGIKSGLTEIDEAAGLVALYTLIIECYVYKDLSIKKDLVRIAKASMALAGAVILILAMANALTNYVVDQHIPDRVLDLMLKLGLDKTWQFLIVMNVFLLVLGMIMDGFSAILVAVPLVLPFAAHFGLGPFHVAIMFVLNLELAFSCPPLGLNLFISSFRFNRPVVSLYRIALPFVGLLAVALLVITYVPRISNQLVLSDIQEWRDRAEKENRTPREAWKLECVQSDPSNPLPCSDEDKKKFPKGQMAAVIAPDSPADAGKELTEDEALEAMIAGKDAGAAKPVSTVGQESEEDLEAMIRGGSSDAGADAAPAKPAPKPGQETEEELEEMIRGKK